MKTVAAFCLLAALATSAAHAQDCAKPASLADGWTLGTPQDAGIDPAALCELDRFISYMPKPTNIHAVVVVRRGKLVAERYYNGEDQRLYKPAGVVQFGPDTRHDLRAITQNVVGLLVGVARAEGKFPALDAPLGSALPDPSVVRPDQANITIGQVLTMSSGMGWNEKAPYEDPTNSLRLLELAPDPVRFVLEQRTWSKPGEFFAYSSGATTLLMAALAKSTGRKLDDYAREKLFAPLGIADGEWLTMPGSNQLSPAGLRLRPRDTAKLGQLLLSDGAWNGTQVLAKGWAAETMKPRVNGDHLFYYGYHWWLGRTLLRGRDLAYAGGIGYGGQRLYVVPGLDMVVMIAAGHYDEFQQFVIPTAIFENLLLPATKD